MAVQPSPGGLIVTLEGNVAPSLRRIAKAHAMLVLDAGADQAFDVVCRQSPPVIILQVGSVLNEALKFIRLVTATARRAPMIATATRHSTRIEQEVLRAGVRYYVPGVRQSIIERMLEAVLKRQVRGSCMENFLETVRSA